MARGGRPSLADLKPKPRNDAYTGLLAISLMAMIAACALLFYDINQYPSIKPGPQDVAPAREAAEPAPTGNPPAGGAQQP